MKMMDNMLLSIVAGILLGLPSGSFASSEPFVGEIMMFGGNFCPRGWTNADGQLVSVSQNQALFSLLGTMYGGDGRTTFGLPDLRGRVPLHAGQGPGLTERRQGTRGGSEAHSLRVAEMPKHQHALNASKEVANQGSPTNNVLATQSRKKRMYAPFSGKTRTPLNANAIGTAGSGQAHNNMQPFLPIRFCIALQGVYPSRN